jgi:uncharacterized damage-inducible protein DinB
MLQHYFLQNLHTTREKSILVWKAFPIEFHQWKPDKDAMHLLEMVRHIYEVQYWFYSLIITKGDVTNIVMPDENNKYTILEDELNNGHQYTDILHNYIKSCTNDDFENIIITRTDKPFTMKLGNFILRCARHEAVHTGQLLSYLRTLQIPRPNIWE